MNNKVLAIVLSIIAVLTVFYQIFLRKDDSPSTQNRPVRYAKGKKPIQQPASRPVSTPNRSGSTVSGSASESESGSGNQINTNNISNRIMIDIYSPQLLKRVTPYIDRSKRELGGRYGTRIFDYTPEKETQSTGKTVQTKLPTLTLNGIIEIIKDQIVFVIINNRLYQKGEMVENAMIKKIEKHRVFLQFNEETIILTVNQDPFRGWIRQSLGGKS